MPLSDETIMSIAGHVSKEMLDLYSHIRLNAKRKAVDALETAFLEHQAADESSQTPVNWGLAEGICHNQRHNPQQSRPKVPVTY